MKPEVLCKCGAMRMLDPSVSCQRGNWIHAVSKCEPTCDECRALLQRVEVLREERDAALAAQKRAEEERDEATSRVEHFQTHAICIWCAEAVEDGKVPDHLLECPDHPMRAAEARAEAAEAARAAMRAAPPDALRARVEALACEMEECADSSLDLSTEDWASRLRAALAPAPPAALRPPENKEDPRG